MKSRGSLIFSIVPQGLPFPQQQQIKSEQQRTYRQKFTPLSLSISVADDNNPDLCFPSCFHSQSPCASCPLQENKVSLWLLLTVKPAHLAAMVSVSQSSALGSRKYNVFNSGEGSLDILRIRKHRGNNAFIMVIFLPRFNKRYREHLPIF